jgi:hypothetical protein
MIKQIAQFATAVTVTAGVAAPASPAPVSPTTGQYAAFDAVYGGDPCFGYGSNNCCAELNALLWIACGSGNVPACAGAAAGYYLYCS